HGKNVRMVERRRGPRLLLEAPQAVGIRRYRRRQYLDRDVALEPRIAGAVHLAHSAAANELRDCVRTDPHAGCQRHRPPATSMNVPVEYDASSESSQTIARATSIASPPRFIGSVGPRRSTRPGSPPSA